MDDRPHATTLRKRNRDDLVGAEATLAPQGEGDAVFGLDAVDSSQHGRSLPYSAQELAHLLVVQSRERPPRAAVLEDADLEVVGASMRPIGSGEGAHGVAQGRRQRLEGVFGLWRSDP